MLFQTCMTFSVCSPYKWSQGEPTLFDLQTFFKISLCSTQHKKGSKWWHNGLSFWWTMLLTRTIDIGDFSADMCCVNSVVEERGGGGGVPCKEIQRGSMASSSAAKCAFQIWAHLLFVWMIKIHFDSAIMCKLSEALSIKQPHFDTK